MGGFGRAIGGLLMGAGQGIAKTAEFQMTRQAKQEDDDALLRRSLALEDAKDQNATTRAMAVADHASELKRGETREELILRGALDDHKSSRDFTEQVKLKEVDFRNELKKLGVQFSQAQSLEAFKTKNNILQWNETTGKENPITATRVGDDGFLYGVRKLDGTTIKLSDVKFPKTAPLDLLGLAGGGGDGEAAPDASAAAPRRGLPSVAPKPSPTPQGQTISPGELSQLYNDASAKAAAKDPRYLSPSGQPLNASQIKAKVQDMLRARGIGIPAGA